VRDLYRQVHLPVVRERLKNRLTFGWGFCMKGGL